MKLAFSADVLEIEEYSKRDDQGDNRQPVSKVCQVQKIYCLEAKVEISIVHFCKKRARDDYLQAIIDNC